MKAGTKVRIVESAFEDAVGQVGTIANGTRKVDPMYRSKDKGRYLKVITQSGLVLWTWEANLVEIS